MLLCALAMGGHISYLSREEMIAGTANQFRQGIARTWDLWCAKAREAYPEIAALGY